MPSILVVCTANQCRSVMAAALLRQQLDRRGLPIEVGSAGFLADGVPPPDQIVSAMKSVGLDVSSHLSRVLSGPIVEEADLILTMERRHALELVSTHPTGLSRTFTAAEFVRRASTFRPIKDPSELRTWAAELSAPRRPADLMGEKLTDDVSDPMGGTRRDFAVARDWQVEWTQRVVDLLAGPSSS